MRKGKTVEVGQVPSSWWAPKDVGGLNLDTGDDHEHFCLHGVIITEACNRWQQEAKERADLCLGPMSFVGLGAEMPRTLFEICFLYVEVVSIKLLSFVEMCDLSLAVS